MQNRNRVNDLEEEYGRHPLRCLGVSQGFRVVPGRSSRVGAAGTGEGGWRPGVALPATARGSCAIGSRRSRAGLMR